MNEKKSSRSTFYSEYKELLNLILLGIGLLSALGIGELFCRIAGVGKPNLSATGPKRLYVPDPDPEIAFRMRSNYEDFVYGADVRINAQGLRDRAYSYEKPDGVKRILILGDSVVFGYGVPVEETFAKQWEAQLDQLQKGRWEIINSGVPSYTTVQEVRWFETEGLKYHPDAVVVTYIMNDPEPVHQLAPDGTFVLLPIDTFYQDLVKLFPKTIMPFPNHSYLSRYLNRTLLNFHPNWKVFQNRLAKYFNEELFTTPGWEQCQAAFRRLKQDCAERNLFLFVAVYPTMYRLFSYEQHPFTPHYKRIQQFLESEQIPCVVPFDDFKGQSVDAMRAYVDDPHPSGKSHLIFAKRLYREFQQRWSGFNGVPDWK